MAAKLWKTSTSNAFSSTLSGSVNQGDNTITLTSVTGLQSPGVLCIDRVDSNGNATPSNREYISFTGISTNTLTGVTRGIGGSSDQGHTSGAIVEENFSVSHWNDLVSFLQASHDASGNIFASLATIATAKITDLTVTNSFNISGASIPTETVRDMFVTRLLYASGASIILTSSSQNLYPGWTFSALASSPSAYVSHPISMPIAGTLRWVSMTLDGPASAPSSIVVDINKNSTSILAAGTRLALGGGGTFVSSSSIATTSFNAGDKFWVDTDLMGGYNFKVTVQAGT